jgi:hypothetical protein
MVPISETYSCPLPKGPDALNSQRDKILDMFTESHLQLLSGTQAPLLSGPLFYVPGVLSGGPAQAFDHIESYRSTGPFPRIGR